MKDIHTPLRTLFAKLIIGLGYTCYEAGAIPDNAVTPYVIIASMDASEKSNKTGFGNNVQTMLDIVTKYEKNKIGGSKVADTIAGRILEVINSKIHFQIFSGLQIVNTKILQDQKLNAQSTTHRIFRRLLRFQQTIMEV